MRLPIGDFGLSAEDIQGIARKLPENHSAIVILFENVWERSFKAITERHGGSLIKQRLVLPDDLAAAARVLARTNNT